jgi:D-serine deaminase-like pyridoxal phosphate-dependent protein
MPRTLRTLATPVPVVDLERMEANLDRMASYAARHGLRLRPHVKTHKAPRVAREQVRRGATGLTCATPREAEVMAPVHPELLVAYPPVGPARTARLVALPEEVRLTVALDSVEAVAALASAVRVRRRPVRVLVELDLGMGRVGVGGPEDAVALARRVADAPPLEFGGVLFYPGHVRQPQDSQTAVLRRLSADLAECLDALHAAGLPAGVVSGGSTPTAWRSHEVAGLTEFRPGTYVYNDRATVETGALGLDECALTVLATVVSTAVRGQAVVDAGTKALGREPRGVEQRGGYGEVLGRPEVTVKAMSEEHGLLDLGRTDWRPRVGDLVRIIPNHVCVVVHLFDRVVGLRGDEVVEEWEVAARGR